MPRKNKLTQNKLIRVAAGVLEDAAGNILIAQRPAGSHSAGWWEFPGGKIEPGEQPLEALIRELGEELGITVTDACFLTDFQYSYPDRTVELHIWRVQRYDGKPVGCEGQCLRWVKKSTLSEVGLLPADLPVIELLNIPSWKSKTDH